MQDLARSGTRRSPHVSIAKIVERDLLRLFDAA